MNNQMNPALQQRLLAVAAQAGVDALADDALPFTCFKCDKPCEDWDGSECETCEEFFCDDCLVDAVQSMAPEICFACDRENRAIQATYDTLQRPD